MIIEMVSCDFTFRGLPDPEAYPRRMTPCRGLGGSRFPVPVVPAKSQNVRIDLEKHADYLETS